MVGMDDKALFLAYVVGMTLWVLVIGALAFGLLIGALAFGLIVTGKQIGRASCRERVLRLV